MILRTTRNQASLILGCLLLLLAQACAVNPVTGRRELMFYSEQDEIAMGKQTHAQIVQQYGLYDSAEVNAYVSRVGDSLTGHTHRAHLEYHFAVLDSPVVNAFAVPGGYIYVTRGILALMNSEAELAVVLAHELGHVNARHSMRRLSNAMLVTVGLTAGSAISKTFADIAGIAGAGMQLIFLKYSRDDEREADELGVLYSRKGLYNPAKMIDFFEALERMGDLSGGQSLPGFLSTHPLTSERIENTRAMIAPEDQGLKVEAGGYLKRIDGMVYGPDPRQGYVEGDSFFHPTLRFVFKFPPGWTVQNLPSQVTMIAPKEDAAVILQAEQSTENPRAYAAARAQKLENATLRGEQAGNVNGLSSFQQVWDVTQEQGETLRAQMTFIRYGPHMYTFTALSLRKDFDAFAGAFKATSSSFRQLSDRRYLNRQPVRLRLVNSDGRRTLREILQQNKMSEKIWPRFAVMNALELDQKPARGLSIKVIR
jgi:predicted Zn-dependent protease